MNTLNIQDMMAMQSELHALHEGEWTPRVPQHAKDFLLYSVAELGEVAQVFQKHGWEEAAVPGTVRDHLMEETGDVFMFLFDMLSSMGVTPEEFSATYARKHAFNIRRVYGKDKFTTDG